MRECCKLDGDLVFRYDCNFRMSEALFYYHIKYWFLRYKQNPTEEFEEICPLSSVHWDAGLTNMNFRNAELQGLNITHEDWTGSDFSGADLSESLLSHGCFQRVRFVKTDLLRVNFSNSDLRGADLSFANLGTYGGFVRGANLVGADLREAILKETNLDNILFDEKTQFPEHFQIKAAFDYVLREKTYSCLESYSY